MNFLAVLALAALALADYAERLTLQPLPRNKLLASFDFDSALPNFPLQHVSDAPDPALAVRHYGKFPRALEPVLHATNTRELHLRFTQGWWDSERWGLLPANGSGTGGTGVELWAAIEARDVAEARASWLRLAELLSGFFCALLNFVDDAITTFPQHGVGAAALYAANATNSVFLLRAALPDEPICTENLTPFLKMLPTRGKAGVSSLLDGHKLYDSLWHSMSVDVVTVCDELGCSLRLSQHIHQVIDVMRSLRRSTEGGIPKPVPGDKLRCDPAKKNDAWVCFPLADETELSWDLQSVFGRPIKGAGFEDDSSLSTVAVHAPSSHWNVKMLRRSGDQIVSHDLVGAHTLKAANVYNIEFSTTDSRVVEPVSLPPVSVARSLTGYSQDKGGMRVSLKNPSTAEPVTLIYYETLPWFMRVYMHTLDVSGTGTIDSQFYKPAIDRKRPAHLELAVTIPPGGDLTFTYQFDKSLLLYAEYPPDANHGFAVAPAVVTVLDASGATLYELRTTSLLLTLPTPDFSMPYNVIILTCTVMALAFGTIFNLLSKKVVTEEEFEEQSKDSKLSKLKAKIQSFKSKFKKA